MNNKYILIKGKAGLGNRILVLLDSLIYSELSGRIPIIDWCDGAYAEYGTNSFPLLFSKPLQQQHCYLAYDLEESIAPKEWRGFTQYSVDKLLALNYPYDEEIDSNNIIARKYTIDISCLSYAETLIVRWGWTHELHKLRHHITRLSTKYTGLRDRNILSHVIKERLQPTDEILFRVNAFINNHFGRNVIGLHIRYSDRLNPYSKYFKIVDRYINSNPDCKIFIATDNSAVECDFRARYKNVITVNKWYPPPGVPIHRNKIDGKDAQINAADAIVELYLLSKCDYLVFNSTSTYGYVASLLSDVSSDRMVDMAEMTIKSMVKKIYMLVKYGSV